MVGHWTYDQVIVSLTPSSGQDKVVTTWMGDCLSVDR